MTSNISFSKVFKSSKKQKKITGVGLFLIICFAIFLRSEHFYTKWQKMLPSVMYQGEYQMVNYDSYYYLQAAKEIERGTYDTFDENRHFPNGLERSYIPPLLSSFAVFISAISGIPISTAAIFTPVYLGSLLALIIFFLARRLGFYRIPALISALFAITSISYIIRTRLGVFDTDCMNVNFLILNAYLFLSFALTKGKGQFTFLILGIISTFLYYIWWNSASAIVILSSTIPLCLGVLLFYKTKKNYIKYLILGSIIITCFFAIKKQLLFYIEILFGKTEDGFVLNDSAEELNKIGFDTFLRGTVEMNFLIIMAIIGLLLLFFKQKIKMLLLIVPLLLSLLPFFAGNRFLIFSAPIVALGIGYFIHFLIEQKKRVKPVFTYSFALIITIIGIYNSYNKFNTKPEKTSAYDNVHLLNELKSKTPDDAHIWTNWSLGYQVNYYLDRKTFADGGFGDGEIFYYLYFPLATENLDVAANFMRFYSVRGVKGVRKLYTVFSSDKWKTFLFLKKILQYSPSEAKKWLQTISTKKLLQTDDLDDIDKWIDFLYPKNAKDIYLLLHNHMNKTVGWFKQGNTNLASKKTVGLPLFLEQKKLNRIGNKISNYEIEINTQTGESKYRNNQQNYFQKIVSIKDSIIMDKVYPENKKKTKKRFEFQWIMEKGYGAIMSEELANTTFIKLYMQRKKSPQFIPVSLKTPIMQIWKIPGNIYETQ